MTVLPTDLVQDSEMAKGIDRCDQEMLVCGDSSGRRHDHPVKADRVRPRRLLARSIELFTVQPGARARARWPAPP